MRIEIIAVSYLDDNILILNENPHNALVFHGPFNILHQ